jgi:hypothetical protein
MPKAQDRKNSNRSNAGRTMQGGDRSSGSASRKTSRTSGHRS